MKGPGVANPLGCSVLPNGKEHPGQPLKFFRRP